MSQKVITAYTPDLDLQSMIGENDGGKTRKTSL
jgi:hypothetical protein